ncbi:MAG: serine hydrolase domain-containing protein, partial [Arenibacterium sp.]
MKIVLRWLGRIVLALILAAVIVGFWKREELTRVWTVVTLFDEDKIVQNFIGMEDAFLNLPLPRGEGPVSPLPQGAALALPDGIDAWLEDRWATSLLVLKDGEIRHEAYFRDTEESDLRISWSIAKSYLSVLMGVLVSEGVIVSWDAPVTDYAPSLVGSGYDGASIRNVLQMSSGVIFDEDYLDFQSDIQRMGRIVALGGQLDDFTASFPERFAEPGERWQYVSIDTHVIGMVIRGATGQSVTDLMAEKVIAPLGLEQDGRYITDGAGTAFVLGGLNFTTRD